MSRFVTVAHSNPGWRNPLIFGWAGMRGVVSLAMALSIPLLIYEGQPFPFRNLILFITFVVILVTLCFQGLTLPWLIRRVKPEDNFDAVPEREQELIIQRKIAQGSLQFLEEKYGQDVLSNERLNNLRERLKIDLSSFDPEFEAESVPAENSLQKRRIIYLEMLEEQRRLLKEMNRLPEFDEELIRKYLSLIDVEEFKIREKQLETDSE
jgi:CPA1 family monovalent cation:H+ antiporter